MFCVSIERFARPNIRLYAGRVERVGFSTARASFFLSLSLYLRVFDRMTFLFFNRTLCGQFSEKSRIERFLYL